MKIFEAYIEIHHDNGIDETVVCYGIAKNLKEFIKEYKGKGDITSVTDVTYKYLSEKTIDLLENDLISCGWGAPTIALIKALLKENFDDR